MSPTIALCVGHSRRLKHGRPEGGAATHDGSITEWAWNQLLATEVAAELRRCHGISAVVIDDYGPRGYSAAMRWLAAHLRSLGTIRAAVELHFNSATPTATGHEWLHFPGSSGGQRLARQLHLAMARHFPTLRARGLKPTGPGARGHEFLRLTHCPAVIAEPFFGSNPVDFALVSHRTAALISALAEGIAAAAE